MRTAETLRTTQPLADLSGWMAPPWRPVAYCWMVMESRVTLVAPPENADRRLRPPSRIAPGSPQKLSPDLGRTLKFRGWVPALTT